jgi:hypothetical protein
LAGVPDKLEMPHDLLALSIGSMSPRRKAYRTARGAMPFELAKGDE